MKKILKYAAAGFVGLFVLIQLVPYGRGHQNPETVEEPAWSSPEVRALAVKACFDCHSNQTRWPWYSQIAPVSWLVQHDVEEGRRELNFSRWDQPQRHIKDAAEEMREGEMPMAIYLPLHPEAKLNAQDQAALITELERIAALKKAQSGASGKGSEGEEKEEHHEEGHEH